MVEEQGGGGKTKGNDMATKPMLFGHLSECARRDGIWGANLVWLIKPSWCNGLLWQYCCKSLCSILAHGIFFPCLIITMINEQKL